MTKTIKILFLAILLTFSCATFAAAQEKAAPDYKITNIKIVPFDSQTGEFQIPIKPVDDRAFFNDLAISLFVTVEISGQAGTFEDGRILSVTVTEGKKSKVKKTEQIGLIGDGGKFYFPIWLESAMCDEITITAKISGQKTASTMKRKVPFMCGE